MCIGLVYAVAAGNTNPMIASKMDAVQNWIGESLLLSILGRKFYQTKIAIKYTLWNIRIAQSLMAN
jgi:hypothetical protein